MLKFTKYHISKETKSGNLIIFNTFTSKIVKVLPSNVEYVKKLINQVYFESDSSEIVNILIEKGFVIDASIDEFKRVERILEYQLDNNKSLAITIMPTELCNFRCTYCYENHKKGAMSQTTIENTISYIKHQIPQIKSLSIGWFGGEPLLELDTIKHISEELIAECKKYNVVYRATITTNGYLLSYDTFLTLYKKCRVVAYQITLDGDKFTHDKQRFLVDGSPTFDVIFNNLKTIHDHPENRFFNIDIRTNLTRFIFENSIDDYINLLDRTFKNDMRFSLLWRPTFGIPDREKITKDQYYNVFTRLENKNLNLLSEYKLSTPLHSLCGSSRRGNIIIGSDGTIYKCSVAFEKSINNIGNINNEEKIDYSKMAFWETRRKNSPTYLNKCNNCKYYPICLSCICPNNMYIGDDIKCKEEKLSILEEKIIRFSELPICTTI